MLLDPSGNPVVSQEPSQLKLKMLNKIRKDFFEKLRDLYPNLHPSLLASFCTEFGIGMFLAHPDFKNTNAAKTAPFLGAFIQGIYTSVCSNPDWPIYVASTEENNGYDNSGQPNPKL